MKSARWLLPVVTLTLVLLVTWWDAGGGGAGPGPLHPAHRGLPALQDGTNCEACHVPGGGIDVAGCVDCHAAIGAQLSTGGGLHGALADAAAQCADCHGEHHGAATPLIAPHSFARAGFGPATTFDHSHTDFQLAGVHTALPCAACHTAADAPTPPAGGRFLGASQRCSTCHSDQHDGAFGGDCADCHGQSEAWPSAPGFTHPAMPLAGGHAALACDACHPTEGSHGVAALRRDPRPARRCGDCHEDPHAGPTPTSLRFKATFDCRRCHAPDAWRSATVTATEHARLGFDLQGRHADMDCASCHGDAERPAGFPASILAADAPPPAPGDCAACHEHPHADATVTAATARSDSTQGCGGCHHVTDTDFGVAWTAMPRRLHAATGVELEQPHATVDCTQCHSGVTRPARFPGRVASDCRACHDDTHGGQFDQPPRYAQCTDCHAATAFLPTRFDAAMHEAGGFVLTGAHDAVACSACHEAHGASGERQFRGTPRTCAGCHDDAHGGRFARRGGMDCARCHNTAAFAPLDRPFDHAAWTGHALTGAHGELACSACHPASAAQRLGPARGTRCADCHRDPHARQFDLDGSTDCRRCHTSATFAIADFDHGTTRFPLDRVHRELDCAACHKERITTPGTTVHYRPLGTSCGDCHRAGGGR